jgi:glycosyltransferase involved in cell wall biosynthesis
VKNPFAYLARSKGLVLTSRFESFALVLVEALACGTVPIAVDCPYGPREVLNDGEYGLLVPMDNPMALADAMFRVATESDYREKFSRIGMQRARNYDLPKMASQWERIIDGLTINVPQKVNAVASAA